MGARQMSFSKIKFLFLSVGLILGIGGGYSGAFIIYQSKMHGYDNQIDALTSEVSRLNSAVSTLEAEILNALDTITIFEKQVSDLESQISILRARVDILYGDITVEQAKELVETIESSVILDVRTVEEFETGHIEGAVNIPVDELQERLGELEKSDEIMVYCRSGVRSSRAMKILADNGFSKVYNMLGGIEAWEQAGYLTLENMSCPCEQASAP